jgi:NAD(P)-dependent dehydrogenase (short-subunit alcohol dehydrogenase family)
MGYLVGSGPVPECGALFGLDRVAECAPALNRHVWVVLRRLGTVEDCAKVGEFFATNLSDYVTGAVIPIDGGLVRG